MAQALQVLKEFYAKVGQFLGIFLDGSLVFDDDRMACPHLAVGRSGGFERLFWMIFRGIVFST